MRRNLSATLSRLQTALGSGWLEIHRDSLALAGDAGLWVDVWEFERLAASELASELQRAVDLYAGDLLPELYEDWILPERELLRNLYLAVLEKLAALYEGDGALQSALLATRRLILAEPLHEPAHLVYLRLLGRLQRYGEAIAHYEYLRQLLQEELGIEPMAEIRQVMRALERERALATAQVVSEEKTEFVGRVPERTAALEAVELALQGVGGILAVEGEAGIGKSRFLREVAAGALWRGATVIQGQVSETPEASPFAPLAAALAPVINSPRMEQVETLLGAETLAALAPLMPTVRTSGGSPDIPVGAASRHFFNALAFFGETLAHLIKMVLILDDLQWADHTLWESLLALARGLIRGGALLLLSYRRPEIEETSGWDILQEWDHSGRLKVISLQPLSLNEVTQLVSDRLPASPAEVLALTSGNPFLISQWLAEPGLGQSSQPFSVARRLPGLPTTARSALEYATVLGDQFPYRLWLEVSELAPLALAGLSDELTAKQWLVHSATGYAFAHDLIRQAIYQEIQPDHRTDIHARAAHAYQKIAPDNYRSRAYHLDLAGLGLEAARIYRKAGEQDLARFAFSEAQQAFDRALTLLPSGPTEERIETALALGRACETTGDRVRQIPALEEALGGARLIGHESMLFQALFAMGRATGQKSQFGEASVYLTEALNLAQKIHDHQREIDVIFELGDLAGQQGKWSEAQSTFLQALESARLIADHSRAGRAMIGLAIAAKQLGRPYDLVKWFEQALAIQRRIGNRLGESLAQANLLGAFYDLGAWDRLIVTAEEALPVAEALGNRVNMAVIKHEHGLAYYALGDYPKARRLFLQAQNDFEKIENYRLVGLAHNTLGLVAEDEGNYEEALHLYRSALANAEKLNAVTEAAYARHDLGALLLRLARPSESVPLLEGARHAWLEQGNALLQLKSEAFLGLARLALGERAQSEELAASAWAAFQSGVPIGEQLQSWLWTLHRLLSTLDQPGPAGQILLAAYAELQRQARAINDPELRRNFFERVPLNRSIVAAYDEHTVARRVISVTLARAEAPLGRPLKAEELVTVEWTVDAPEDEAFAGKNERRRYRLIRLLREAERQEAAPTDDDLASALGVSRRTILRDIHAMEDDLPFQATRKRRKYGTS